ncbi:hypothetical protein H5410_029954 [Solanum commersonii]|uniref:Fatty acid hydroxylase domain-containing protein n=1 Tax=Solanum commersonii TaxID=4109 RepID=A0A9J5YG37_SOLCO|nr:hypothetical protein H5410_029954 [Solanum commersonii]
MASMIESAWAFLLANFSDFQLTSLGGFIVHESAFFLSGIPFILFERAGWFGKYKIQKKTNAPEAQQKCITRLLMFHFCVNLPILIVTYPLFKFMGMRSTLPLPSWYFLALCIPSFKSNKTIKPSCEPRIACLGYGYQNRITEWEKYKLYGQLWLLSCDSCPTWTSRALEYRCGKSWWLKVLKQDKSKLQILLLCRKVVSTHVLFYFILEDFVFYWGHRVLHTKWLYKHVHSVHHEYVNYLNSSSFTFSPMKVTTSVCYTRYATPFGLTSEYAHPAEILFLGFATVIGPAITGPHLITLYLWISLRILETVEAHSGYHFPWSPSNFLPLYGGSDFHDYHHRLLYTKSGNYSSTFVYMDWLFGTDKGYRKLKMLKEQECKAEGKAM